MNDDRIRASIEAYVAAWNEYDAAERMRLLERSCAQDVVLQTSGRRVHGLRELDAMIADFHQRLPGHRAVFSSVIDVQGGLFRYTGVVEDAEHAHAGDAFDAGTCDDDGRIRLLLTFVGAAVPK